MTWFRIDDKFGQHPKVLSIPRAKRRAAIGLWTLSGTWSAGNLTGGFIPAIMLAEIGAGATPKDALVLVEARLSRSEPGLWLISEDGWQFHDWEKYQPTREEIEERRARDAERLRRWRARQNGREVVG